MEATTNGQYRFDIAPSLLSKKILCPAYTPAPFNSEDRLLYVGLHAIAALKVIARKVRLRHWLRVLLSYFGLARRLCVMLRVWT